MQDVTAEHNPELDRFVGADTLAGIVSVERSGDHNVRIYRRTDSGIEESIDSLSPWMVTTASVASTVRDGVINIETLQGDAAFSSRVRFEGWSAWSAAYRWLRESNTPIIAFPSPAEQYLIDTGRGCFRGMAFEQLRRAQLDIETLGLDPHLPDAQIIIITAAINGRHPLVLRADQLSERAMISELTDWIRVNDQTSSKGTISSTSTCRS